MSIESRHPSALETDMPESDVVTDWTRVGIVIALSVIMVVGFFVVGVVFSQVKKPADPTKEQQETAVARNKPREKFGIFAWDPRKEQKTAAEPVEQPNPTRVDQTDAAASAPSERAQVRVAPENSAVKPETVGKKAVATAQPAATSLSEAMPAPSFKRFYHFQL